MTDKGSVSHWIEGVKEGDSFAARQLWERYFEKLVRLARRQLKDSPRRVADEEDIALGALDSFCRAAQLGRFPNLADRDSLWRLLIRMTTRKAVDLIRYNARQKRKVSGESAIADAIELEMVASKTPTPEFAATMADECRRLLELLGDKDLQTIAVAKMEGFKNAEIAKKLDCSISSVKRQLQLIRMKWEPETPP